MLHRLSSFSALALCASGVSALNILLTNDDSWASANVRATFTALQKAGHNVVLVGPAVQQSGKGGTFVLPTTNIVAPGGEFGSIAVGAPFFGQDVTNPNLWYFNGTPAATAAFALDVIVPKHFGKPANQTLDLVVSGPNEGTNNGPFLYTLSGTIGATYISVERGAIFPAIAFSAGNSTHRSFTTNTGAKDDPANLAGQVVANLVQAVSHNVDTKRGERILPLGIGMSSNLPVFGPGNPCTNPPFVLTRMTGGALAPSVTLDTPSGFPEEIDFAANGINTCINGICQLPGETVVSAKCETSVSIFSVDYDAPTLNAAPIQARLEPFTGKPFIPF
ncbi:5'/3'-nucleotidase sure [Schizopora paradoxa]|uniref:5'/3'-nucleotidase sure n=1 Tax=Schizopora paradoxa TaxID=27342 RepID=A0A0H2REY4_9AGAM|nr:5'/3'-nucleotidase sure [Schizopora paradoxa]